ncbi:TPA: hypothetical protein H2C15_004447 [Salmonella enterica]|nr:hypothetical protein [Salmonella enterica]
MLDLYHHKKIIALMVLTMLSTKVGAAGDNLNFNFQHAESYGQKSNLTGLCHNINDPMELRFIIKNLNAPSNIGKGNPITRMLTAIISFNPEQNFAIYPVLNVPAKFVSGGGPAGSASVLLSDLTKRKSSVGGLSFTPMLNAYSMQIMDEESYRVIMNYINTAGLRENFVRYVGTNDVGGPVYAVQIRNYYPLVTNISGIFSVKLNSRNLRSLSVRFDNYDYTAPGNYTVYPSAPFTSGGNSFVYEWNRESRTNYMLPVKYPAHTYVTSDKSEKVIFQDFSPFRTEITEKNEPVIKSDSAFLPIDPPRIFMFYVPSLGSMGNYLVNKSYFSYGTIMNNYNDVSYRANTPISFISTDGKVIETSLFKNVISSIRYDGSFNLLNTESFDFYMSSDNASDPNQLRPFNIGVYAQPVFFAPVINDGKLIPAAQSSKECK